MDGKDAKTKTGKPARGERSQKPIKACIAEIDQEILRLLVRRANLLGKIRDKGRIPVADEKYLREAWQNDVARVSRDPELSGRFFSLLQNLSFLPRPGEEGSSGASGAMRRQAFNLAPPRLPVHLDMKAPLASFQTCGWLYLAAAAGAPIRLSPCLQNDPLVDYVHGLAQIGAAITREDAAIITRPAPPLPAPDKVIHTGSGIFSLFMFMAHYLGRYSRVKFTGNASLQMLDLSSLHPLLLELGARLVNIVPKSNGLPARLEASGILPPGVTPARGVPEQFVEALLLAAPLYATPFAVDLQHLAAKEAILSNVLPLLEASGAIFSLQSSTLSFEPAQLVIPAEPEVPMDSELAAFLLALAAALGGDAILEGFASPGETDFWQLCADNGFKLLDGGIEARFAQPLTSFRAGEYEPAHEWQIAFLTALASCAALRGGEAVLPMGLETNDVVNDFLRVCGLTFAKDGRIERGEASSGFAWNAPAPGWALALAIAACARPGKGGIALGNPGIVTEIWPPFWSIYNNLQTPKSKKQERAEPAAAPKPRRRIMTSAVAVPHEIREEDWN